MTDMDKAIEEARAAVLPFESWERLPGESGRAYAAFCVYRDMGLERNIRKAVDGHFRKAELLAEFSPEAKTPHDTVDVLIGRKYRMWRNWCSLYRWRERAADYDRYMESLKQTEKRKTIETQGERHRAVTGKMLTVVEKKLDLMDPADLTQGTVTEWVEAAIRAEREGAGLVTGNSTHEPKQGDITFTPDFNGL
jgi:hypothetical protein